MKIGAGVIIALVLSCGAVPAAAQDAEFFRQVGVEARDVGLDRMADLVCGSVACEPVTEQERASPPVSDDQAAAIAAVAVVSAAAEHCGLDWRNESYLPMMAGWRAMPEISDRKLALVGWTHGFVQGQALEAFEAIGVCDEQNRAAVQSLLDQTRD
jgi:hypothetical protein